MANKYANKYKEHNTYKEYEEALENIGCLSLFVEGEATEYSLAQTYTEDYEKLEELVEKVKPKTPEDIKPILTYHYGNCPICFTNVTTYDNYCSYCGQKLKWKKVREKK